MSRKRPPKGYLDARIRRYGNGAHIVVPKAWRLKKARVRLIARSN